MVLFSRLAFASHYGTSIDFLNPAALRCVRHTSFIIMTDGLLTLITLRGQLASRIQNTKGRQPKHINAILNRSPDLGIPSRTRIYSSAYMTRPSESEFHIMMCTETLMHHDSRHGPPIQMGASSWNPHRHIKFPFIDNAYRTWKLFHSQQRHRTICWSSD